jgi:hypothetical protein
MLSPVAALKAGALALLASRGQHEAEHLLEAAELELVGPDELWAVGNRTVSATVVALVLDGEPFACLRRDRALLELVRQALGDAMASDRTALKELVPCLRLPGIGLPWRQAYRTAARTTAARRPEPEAVLAAAAAVLQAEGAQADAELLSRCTLELGESELGQEGGGRLLLRCVLHVPPAELGPLRRERERLERLRQALSDAAARPLVALGEVTLGVLAPRGS